jgi:hypothetical protein
VSRLGEGILDERGVGLVGLGNPEFGLSNQLDRARSEQRTELAQLARVARCENQLHELKARF